MSAQSLDKNLVELPDGTQGYWILSGTVGAGLTAATRNCLLVAALQIAETVASPIALAEAEWKQAQHDWKRAREAEERAAEARRDAREILDSAQENLYRIKARRAEQGPL